MGQRSIRPRRPEAGIIESGRNHVELVGIDGTWCRLGLCLIGYGLYESTYIYIYISIYIYIYIYVYVYMHFIRGLLERQFLLISHARVLEIHCQ